MITRVFGGEDGETHLTVLDLPESAEPINGVSFKELRDIPTTTLGITEMLGRRRKWDIHPAPRRQLVIVVRGVLEITSSDGKSARLGVGDVLFADDVGAKGHGFEDVGDEPLYTFQVGIDPAWEWPPAV